MGCVLLEGAEHRAGWKLLSVASIRRLFGFRERQPGCADGIAYAYSLANENCHACDADKYAYAYYHALPANELYSDTDENADQYADEHKHTDDHQDADEHKHTDDHQYAEQHANDHQDADADGRGVDQYTYADANADPAEDQRQRSEVHRFK